MIHAVGLHNGEVGNMGAPVIERVVIATDGSEVAMKAVEFGVELAGLKGAEVTLVHVVPSDRVRDDEVYWDAEDQAILQEAGDTARAQGVEPKLMMCSGSPAEAITKIAEDIDADMVVMGSRGRGTVTGRLLGSVSRGVLGRAHRPVLVVQ
jgi:nucleotide-binding universal stress UspA family protein